VCENAGLDASEIVTDLRSRMLNGDMKSGIDIVRGCVGNMEDLGVMECCKVK